MGARQPSRRPQLFFAWAQVSRRFLERAPWSLVALGLLAVAEVYRFANPPHKKHLRSAAPSAASGDISAHVERARRPATSVFNSG
jgi:hypothetical protein